MHGALQQNKQVCRAEIQVMLMGKKLLLVDVGRPCTLACGKVFAFKYQSIHWFHISKASRLQAVFHRESHLRLTFAYTEFLSYQGYSML